MFEASFTSEIKSVKANDDGSLYIEGYANTVSKDRAGDVIPKTAWETPNALTNYQKNPIILAYHDHSKPIGRMVSFEVTELGLKIKAQISKGAGDVYNLIKDGILSTFSVGFGILDAEYDHKSDTYFIKDVELHEVSVVSVPCNQDSTFSVAKSMKSDDFERFKTNITPNIDEGKNKENKMTLEEIQKMTQDMIAASSATNVEATSKAVTDAIANAKALEAAAAKAESDLEAKTKADSLATRTEAKAAAEELVKELRGELTAKDGAFADLVKANNDQIVALKDEIAQVVASRNKPFNAVATGVKGSFSADESKTADNLVMLGAIKKMSMFDTSYGKGIQTATKSAVGNTSSSIAASSAEYETIFSMNLIRDIQAALVISPLFSELMMTSANLVIPINPGRNSANWVAAAEVSGSARTAASSGSEISFALTEKTVKTFKLAAKTYLTEETEEDAIISLVPILRQHLVEAHANEMDNAFLNGSGSGEPKGLITQAKAVAAGAQTQVTLAKSDGSVKVTALGITEARRKMGLYGIDIKDISLVVSQDAYWDLVLDTEWSDVQMVGSAATKLVGEVGNIYGMKVLVSNHFPEKAAGSAFAVMVNTSNFIVTRQRGLTLRSDFDIELDRTVFVATQRINLEPMIEASDGNGKGVVAVTYATV
jgi:HK97 family phage prohead protease/HK97 family phage major capsid protein